ncbi:SHOCT domain-containing protein [Pelagibacterales bacterium SAG-MED46]|nr:SHOCT domain-containing protein [Pelagibacterales bacterium SAG-MED46]
MNNWLAKQANFHRYFEKNLNAKKHHLLDLDKFTTFKKPEENNLLIEQLKSLDDLYKSGVLTKDDFEKAKQKILN